MPAILTDTPLGRTIAETPTDIWNDSCHVDELAYAVETLRAFIGSYHDLLHLLTEAQFG